MVREFLRVKAFADLAAQGGPHIEGREQRPHPERDVKLQRRVVGVLQEPAPGLDGNGIPAFGVEIRKEGLFLRLLILFPGNRLLRDRLLRDRLLRDRLLRDRLRLGGRLFGFRGWLLRDGLCLYGIRGCRHRGLRNCRRLVLPHIIRDRKEPDASVIVAFQQLLPVPAEREGAERRGLQRRDGGGLLSRGCIIEGNASVRGLHGQHAAAALEPYGLYVRVRDEAALLLPVRSVQQDAL